MADYRQIRAERERIGKAAGIVLTGVLHLLVIVCCAFTGFKYLYPPPPEQSILIDFEEDVTPPEMVKARDGQRPRSEEVDRTRPEELVQESRAQHVGTKPNEAQPSRSDEFGDVDTHEAQPEETIDRRALFSVPDNHSDKDTLAAQTARQVSDGLKAGHPQGNVKTGKTQGAPVAHLKGRSVIGSLPKPAYGAEEEGTVVVDILVDQYGHVTGATAGAPGTNVTDKSLWAAARKAAMEARFNPSASAEATQKGTITYKFKIEK